MFVRLKLPQGAWSTLYFSDLATMSVNGKNVETTKDCKSLLSWFLYFCSFEARLSGLRCLWMLNQHFTFEMKHRRRVRDFFENTLKCKIFTLYFFCTCVLLRHRQCVKWMVETTSDCKTYINYFAGSVVEWPKYCSRKDWKDRILTKSIFGKTKPT